MKALRWALAVCLVLVAVSCSLKTGWDLAGKWQQMEGKDTIEFNQNGTVVLASGSTALTAPYKFIDAKELKVDLGLFGSVTAKVSVDKDVLTLKDAAGKETKFKKAK